MRLTYLHEMIRLYGFRDIYDDKMVPLTDLETRRQEILSKLLTISKDLKKRTNMTYLSTLKLKSNLEKQPDAERMTWRLGNREYTYLVPTPEQLVKQALGSAFLKRETGLRLFEEGGYFRIAGFHPIYVLDGRDGSPKKGRRNPQVMNHWAPLLPPDIDPYL